MPTCEMKSRPHVKGCRRCGVRSSEGTVQTVIPGDLAEAQRVLQDIARLLQASGYGHRDRFAIHLALDEALVNAIKHGNQMDRNKRVFIDCRVTDEQLEITIEDEGDGFNPDDLADPLAVESLERPCGRGVFLMRRYMSSVVYHFPGNKVTLTRFRSSSGAGFDG